MKKYIVVFLVLCPALLPARTWTAKDGRTLQGECLSATADAVVVTCYDGRTVTIPLSMLSDADVAYVHDNPNIPQTAAPEKAPDFPKLRTSGDTDENDRLLEVKYEKLARTLTDSTSPRTLKIFKDALTQDTAYWQNEAGYNSKTCATLDAVALKTKTAAARQQADAAKKKGALIGARVAWLTKTLPDWIVAVAKVAGISSE